MEKDIFEIAIIILVILWVLVFVAAAGRLISRRLRKHRHTNQPFQQVEPLQVRPPSFQVKPLSFAEHQLEAVKANDYCKQNLLNNSEKQLYWNLVKLLKGKYVISAQPSLGEILSCKDFEGYQAINSKRVDFVIVDMHTFSPVAVLEYHGRGHLQGDAMLRDEIKENAIRKAGMVYLCIKSTELEKLAELLKRSEII